MQICHIAGPEDGDLRPFNRKRWEADARLMAAAPELLAELKQIRLLFQTALLCTTVEIAREARPFLASSAAAIAKAEAR